MSLNRRTCLKGITSLVAGMLGLHSSPIRAALEAFGRAPTVLVGSGIQYSNIGDIAHVTGVLGLLNTFVPEARIILWPKIEAADFNALIHRHFPDVQIVNGRVSESDKGWSGASPELTAAAESADFFIAGKGSTDKAQWFADHFDRPFGIYGIAVNEPPSGRRKDLFDRAEFVFVRETISEENLRVANIQARYWGFAPDASFGSMVLDTGLAADFMDQYGLEHKNFICVVPRLRRTPYYRIPMSLRYSDERWSAQRIKETDALNNKRKERDHAKAREAIIAWVRRTGNPVLVCPEMIHTMEISEELLIDPLPADIRKQVINRPNYWLTGEAAAVYKSAAAVISLENHSPILAAVQGTPAFYLRQPEDTIKGQMWYDIGLEDWVFEIDEVSGRDIADRLTEVLNDYDSALAKLESAMDYVRKLQRESMMAVARSIGVTS